MKRATKSNPVKDSEVSLSLRHQAAIIPVRAADVEICERLNEETTLPSGYMFLSPADLLQKGLSKKGVSSRRGLFEQSGEENMARAAREGGILSAEIEEKMHGDRNAARLARLRDRDDEGHK